MFLGEISGIETLVSITNEAKNGDIAKLVDKLATIDGLILEQALEGLRDIYAGLLLALKQTEASYLERYNDFGCLIEKSRNRYE